MTPADPIPDADLDAIREAWAEHDRLARALKAYQPADDPDRALAGEFAHAHAALTFAAAKHLPAILARLEAAEARAVPEREALRLAVGALEEIADGSFDCLGEAGGVCRAYEPERREWCQRCIARDRLDAIASLVDLSEGEE